MTARTSEDRPAATSPQPPPETSQKTLLDPGDFDAVLLDLDGVITDTARVHAKAWKAMFDEYLRARAARLGSSFQPFDAESDYKRYVDGRPRADGVACFLQARGISLPDGGPSDPPDRETIASLASRKNHHFLAAIRRDGVETYASSLDFIRRAQAKGLALAVVSSSRNCSEILQAAAIDHAFDAQVDGIVAHDWWLEGKPSPDTYLEASRRLGVDPKRAMVVEDAVSGVEAGKAGHFGMVVGVDRDGLPELLRKGGADIVVPDLGALAFENSDGRPAQNAPLALERLDEVRERIRDHKVAVFLDYDGTLTPIVERPELAVLSASMRSTLKALAKTCTVVVVSGRERSDVENLVGLKEIIYAGCHGFDIVGPRGTEIRHEEGESYVPKIHEAAAELRRRLSSIEGVLIEEKTYALAVHFRLVRPGDVDQVEQAVDAVVAEQPDLRKTDGKKVFELRPNIDWDKGKAVLWLLDALDLSGPDILPFYLGDDVTDFDAFHALRGKGVSLLVAEDIDPASADYHLSSPAEAGIFLEELTEMLGGELDDG